MVEMAVGTSIGLLLTLVATGALGWCGHLAARRFWPGARASVRLAANATVSLALVMAIFYPLALAGALNRWAAAFAAAAFAAAAHLAWGGRRGDGGDWRRCAGWLRLVAASRGGALLLGVGIVALFALYRAAVWPPLSYDSLNFHNYVAGTWVQAGGLVDLPYPKGVSDYAYFPTNFHALLAWVMLPFHSDFLVNFVNLPLLALAAVSVYGLCRELELGLEDSSLAAGFVCLSPAMLAYVTTQYADIFVAALLLAGALFMARCLRAWSWPDATMGFLACALSVGAKHSALLPAGLLCVLMLAAAWRQSRKSLPATLGLCAVLMVAFGGYRHIRNWAETGNPLYPMNVRVLGANVFPGSAWASEAERILGRGSWRDDVRQLARSATYSYGEEPAPLSWGPKMPLLAALALLALARARHSPSRGLLRALALCWIVPLLAFYLDPSAKSAIVRRFWHLSCCRLLGLPVGLMAASALAGVSLLWTARAAAVVRAVLCGFLLLDLCVMCVLPDSPDVLLLVACVVPVALALALLVKRFPRFLVVALATVGLLGGAIALAWVRDAKRGRFYATRTDLHPIPRHWVDGWAFCDKLEPGRVVALASFSPGFGDHWFFYPLMGRRLQNVVRYVPAGDDSATWMSNLRAAGTTHVFVQLNPEFPLDDRRREPQETDWIRLRPDGFKLVHQDANCRIYELRR